MRALFLSIAVAVGVLVCSGQACARTAACTCNPCGCAPCTCGQSRTSSTKPQPTKTTAPTKTAPSKTQTTKPETPTTQSKSHQAKKEYGHDHRGGGVGVGVGVNVDLGGIGQRRAEPDPFAISSKTTLPPKTASGEEKVRSDKRPHHKSSDDDLWSQINPIAKEIPELRSAVTGEPKPGRPQ